MNDVNLDQPPLHTQNPLGRFTNRATDYARYRPDYPGEAIDAMLDGLAPVDALVIADIGAGTGISARQFADRGATVWAVEPNRAMREAAIPHERVEFRAATAEETRLPDRSVDLLICCQSFHWFRPEASLAEFHRVLKPGGRIALMWNDRDLNDAFTCEYSQILRSGSDQSIFDRSDRKSSDALAYNPRFTNFRRHNFSHRYQVDLERLIGLTLSASYTQKEGLVYEQLLADLESLYERWTQVMEDGQSTVQLIYYTNVYLAEAIVELAE
ncbi:MAG: class I SAM-dependent methyltransferase [Leptolyngbyaceae cyanobacterium SL_7_1]|nr:class I SAM-dependent methyltransferase [Leptolyngbyaceae cyanobacterium SL_7_1]